MKMPKNKFKLSEQVISVKKNILSITPSDPLPEVAKKLIVDEKELEKDCYSMWRSIEKRKVGSDDLWVWGFLKVAYNASSLPSYHHMKIADRHELSKRIKNLTRDLSRALKTNDLDAHIIFNDGKIFNGFFVFEDLGESNQQQAAEKKRILFTDVLREICNRLKELLKNEPIKAKTGKNERAIRFIRIMHQRNMRVYGTPLNQVIATASNLLFETKYSASDIRKLISR